MGTIISVMLCLSFTILTVLTLSVILHRPGTLKRPVPAAGKKYPKVSILKPVTGTVDDMEQSLESFFELDYEDYEILFGVTSLSDPYVGVINGLINKHRGIRAQVIEVGVSPLQNPKIHTLSKLESHAGGLLYWIADSNIKVGRDVLRSLVDEYVSNGSKMVFSPIRGTGSGTLASIMENENINFFVSGGMIFGWSVFRKQIITGKSTVIEKEALDACGGFSHFKNYLAEDFIMGEAFTEHKFKISSNYVWVDSVNETTTLTRLFRRLERWAKLRLRLKWYVYVTEILFNPMMIALAGALFLGGGWLWIFLFTVAAKVALEYSVYFSLNSEDAGRLRIILLFPAAVILKDVMLFAVYLIPFFSSTVIWNNKRITIGKNTMINVPAV